MGKVIKVPITTIEEACWDTWCDLNGCHCDYLAGLSPIRCKDCEQERRTSECIVSEEKTMEPETKIERFMDKDVLIHRNLKMVALVSASMIIIECDNWKPINIENDYIPDIDTVLGNLIPFTCWSRSGYINALEAHVQIVYAIVKHNIDCICENTCLDIREALILTNALDKYQGWKESVVKRGQEQSGEDWGTATDFNKMVWNKHNDALIELFKR